jgi:MacB-like periplasmic core domain
MRDGLIVSDKRRRPPSETAHALREPAAAPFASRESKTGGTSSAGYLAFFAMILGAATQALARNKMRSALTMLGVFIGVAALIVMVAVGQGADHAVRKQIEGLGANVVVILPGTVSTGGFRAGFGSASTLTVADAHAIRREDHDESREATVRARPLLVSLNRTPFVVCSALSTTESCRRERSTDNLSASQSAQGGEQDRDEHARLTEIGKQPRRLCRIERVHLASLDLGRINGIERS